MARRRSNIGARVAPALPGLEVHPATTRAQTLLRERARLLREVQKQKARLEQFEQKASRDAQEAVAKMAPLVERQRVLVTELSALFNELLAEGRLSALARKQVARIRRTLEAQGLLAPVGDFAEDDDIRSPWGDDAWSSERDDSPRSSPHRGRAGEARDSRGREDTSEPEVASARQPGQERRSLRDIFRNLARAVHPDRAGHDGERARRTEVMKEVTRAYEEGDLARLIELESTWQSQQAPTGAADSEVRCRELERINRELLDQVRELTRQLRDIKRDAREASFGLSLDELVEQAGRELDDFQGICEFVRKFRNGKITLAELVRGPPQTSHRDADDLAFLERLILEELEGFESAPRSSRGRRKQPRR
ncbi:MAG TPA: J domain-containing protein [Polyangiaceae bacterium]|nr:J domain-containing protein [Polyangiaceae bacterium]